MSDLGSPDRPLRVAVVGSGPSGFYGAEALLKAEMAVEVDMFERLPAPYGLVRLGVAPDHPKIKNVIKIYERIAQKEGFRFFGNVSIGRDLSLDELRIYYDAIILAYGAASDRRLNVPGEDLPGSHTATDFVAWYNGHPDYRDHHFDLSHPVAVVVGQGNVAIDVSRILAKTVDELRETDIAQHALDVLSESKVSEIHMVGRRGPVQAKFTQIEIKEMGRLADCDPVVDPASMDFDAMSRAEYESADNKHAQRIVPILEEFSRREAGHKRKRLHIDFLKSPKEIVGENKVEKIILEKNRLRGKAFSLRAEGTGETEELDCGLVLRSVGYKGKALAGAPFDENRGVVPNEEGRVLDDGKPVAGLYTVGWIKRGPSGIIGTNKPDSRATVQALLEDVGGLARCEKADTEAVRVLLSDRGVRMVSFSDWQKIDAREVERGESVGKPREKFARMDEMLAVLDED